MMQAEISAVRSAVVPARARLCPSCGAAVVATTTAPAPAPLLPWPGAALTRRECMILDLVAEGFTDQQIARRTGISTRTVHKHLEHVYAKLGVHGRVAVAVRWVRRGAVTDQVGPS
ncbi:MAG: LuxR C-terminal-related transcriptional regulator [Mycobacteriales bacterium]